ncbi:MAG TPA: TIGR00730 family Rossman fold protein [Hyphomicrobiaceae bacterium]|jgi:uncharacterized protein (TIGR00730 family)|nr:TIGR00730 family Rossman fold protein [Hyphomicrobiaceae bacterium]
MKICIFCGSSSGHDPIYRDGAAAAARAIALAGATLVFGGGRVGLMGVIADAALGAGGEVIGVMPRALVQREIAHRGLNRLEVVETMHDRKTTMSALADAFLALPGGAGTLEEIFEQWTWGQLGIHRKPCAFLNLKGYFDPLRGMVEKMVAEGFLLPQFATMLMFSDNIESILAGFQSYQPPLNKWSTDSMVVAP